MPTADRTERRSMTTPQAAIAAAAKVLRDAEQIPHVIAERLARQTLAAALPCLFPDAYVADGVIWVANPARPMFPDPILARCEANRKLFDQLAALLPVREGDDEDGNAVDLEA